MKKTVLFIAFLLLLGSGLKAQESGDMLQNGSLYSKPGIGFPLDFSSSSAGGMGLFGVSYLESFVPSLANPAHWGFTNFGMATGGISFQNISAANLQESDRNSLLAVNNFQAQLPLKQNKIGVSVSFAPLTRTRYQLFNTETTIIPRGADTDTLSYRTENLGSGGLNQLEVGVGWRLTNNLAVGYGTSLIFASIDDRFNVDFENSGYQDVSFNNRTSGLGWGNRFGVQLSLPDLLQDGDELDLGTTINLPVRVNADRVQESEQVSRENPKTIIIKEGAGLGNGNISLPLSLSGGISYYYNDALAFGVEGKYEQWSDFEYDFDVTQEQLMTDRYKIGAGFRYFPFINGSDKFFSQFKYRLGASYDTGHLDIQGKTIETLMFSAGIGIMSPNIRTNSNSSIDVSIQYGIRGTKSQKLVKEQIWGLRLSLNLAELIFHRPKLQ